MKKLIIAIALLPLASFGQDISYNRHIVDTLASAAFWGRGYTRNGMQKAADFLVKEFKRDGLKPLDGKNYLQKFSYPVNTYPGRMEVSINGHKLTPGVDFIVSPESRGLKATATLLPADSITYADAPDRLYVQLQKKLTWSAEQRVADYTEIDLDRNRFTEIPKSISVNIESKFVPQFSASNVCAYVPGTAKPDSFIFITAHYDHLGGMGSDTYFPGANDNASGDALLLALAKYYAAHPQRYSIGFILFAGEEAGLVGSQYFTEHPLVPLQKIRFLTNTDLAGTGSQGITVVNATLFAKEFNALKQINKENGYLADIGERGIAANSDHYWFTEHGVPAFFFYTRGGIAAYHDVFDRPATLPLTKQAELMQLLIKFNGFLQGN